MNKSAEILNKYWGFSNFRPLQEDIVESAIYGHDTLALLPTGGGKSICFQVPGLARDGITIVISPLIALMQDQVNNLQKRNIRAKAIISGMSYHEIDLILDNACFGGLDFLYTSPERIQSKLFIERFKRMNVGLIVVDEAHCISEWGHDFRPSFKEIHKLREHHPEVPIIALTATATKRVREDIIGQLRLKDPKVFEAPFDRDNLSYECFKVENKLTKILEYCQTEKGKCGIVYCQTRKSVKDVAKLLQAGGISVGIYHGGMSKEDRDKMLTLWLKDKIKVIVATNAFGMGIDKPDVRFVLHYEFPPSLEAYFQEAGRAGRDGNNSRTIVFWEEKDIKDLDERIQNSFPPIETIKLVYRALCSFLKIAIGSGKDETYHFEIKRLSDNFKLNPLEVYNSLKILELNGDLSFSEGVFHPTKVKFNVGNKELYNFQIKNERLLGITMLLARSYPGIFDQFFEIHVSEFLKRLKITQKEMDSQLQTLEKHGIVEVSWASSLPSVTFIHERLPDDYLSLSPEVYRERKNNAQNKLNAVKEYLQKPECRSVQLLRYFGQDSKKCGKCDVCLNEQKQELPVFDAKKIIMEEMQNTFTPENCSNKLNIRMEIIQSAIKELILDEKLILRDKLYEKIN